MEAGNYVFMLHTHLPYVRFPITGTADMGATGFVSELKLYIPLLNSFNELMAEGIKPKITLDISPILCEQLEHPDFPCSILNSIAPTKFALPLKMRSIFENTMHNRIMSI